MTDGFDPIGGPFRGSIRVPGSKSLTIRALATAALARGRSHIYGALVADDTRSMVGMFREFGVAVDTTGEPWTVDGSGGYLQTPGESIDAGDSGLTARIGIAFACLAQGPTTIDGSQRLRERPIGPLIDLVRSQGIDVDSAGGTLPVTVHGHRGLWGGEMALSEAPTSQLVTALLLVAPVADQPSQIRLPANIGSEGYIDLTAHVMRAFGANPSRTIIGYDVPNAGYIATDFNIEPDMSSAVYPLVAAAITGSTVELEGIRRDSVQPDVAIVDHLQSMGCEVTDGPRGLVLQGPSEQLVPIDVDLADSPDGALGLAVAALFASGTSRISGLGSLPYKESDRIVSLSEGLSRLGAVVSAGDDIMTISGPATGPATIDPHGDHRVAMSIALAGLQLPGIRIADANVVKKTWPEYWDQMGRLVASQS